MSATLVSPLAIDPAVQAAGDLIAKVDACFVTGLSRLGQSEQTSLEALAAAVAGTPLGPGTTAAVDGLTRHEYDSRHFAMLAAARAAIQGAMYDALRAQAAASLTRPQPAPAASADGATADPFVGMADGVRQWLIELALAGWKNLESDSVLPFATTLDALLEQPVASRVIPLLLGFYEELLSALPIRSATDVPGYRWSDLWGRCLLNTYPASPNDSAAAPVSGQLTVLGADVQHHAYMVHFVVYGCLEPAESGLPPQVVTINATGYKVDAIPPAEWWTVVPAQYQSLAEALADGRRRPLSDATLSPTGRLSWSDPSSLGPPAADAPTAFDLFAADAPMALRPAAWACDRHPLHLAEPVLFNSPQWRDSPAESLTIGDSTLPVLNCSTQAATGWNKESLADASAIIGLLRFDAGQWSVQPIAAQAPDGVVCAGRPVVAANAKRKGGKAGKSGDTSARGILQERAGVLLREKPQPQKKP